MMIYVTLQGEMCNSCVWHHSDKHDMSDGTEKNVLTFFSETSIELCFPVIFCNKISLWLV